MIETANCVEWLPTITEASVDLVIADPPYNIGYEYAEGSPSDKLNAADYVAWCRQWIQSSHRVLRPGGWLYVIISPHYGPEIGVLVREAGFDRQEIIWREGFGTYLPSKWSYEHRTLYAGWKPGNNKTWNSRDILVPSARQQKYKDKRANAEGRVPGDVWDFSRVCGTFHERVPGVPTQLPVTLVDRIVRAHTNPGDLVIDPFCGSGTTAFVCKQLQRRCRSVDINPTYVAIAKQRLDTITGL